MDIEVIITKQDYDNSSKNFYDTKNCPAAVAIKRTLGRDDITVGGYSVDEGKDAFKYDMKPLFTENQFNRLASGEIQEFRMTLYEQRAE